MVTNKYWVNVHLLILILRAQLFTQNQEKELIKMAKTKWIVPAIALVICAASLVGAAYAAYSATLTDNETKTVEHNYVELSIGDYNLGTDLDIFWKYAATSTNGGAPTATWTPYLVKTCPTGAQTADLGTFSVTGDVTGDQLTSTTYQLEIKYIAFTGVTLTGATVSIVLASDGSEVDDSALTYGTVYKLILNYTQNGSTNQANVEPGASSMTYTLSVTANVS